jgi:arsenite methyltransferase
MNSPTDSHSGSETHDSVREYYGQVLKAKEDLKTSACCLAEAVPIWQKPLLKKIHPDVLSRFYGCGSPLPADLSGLTVLDLGCGTGRDVYLLSQLVGECGQVIGVDMTDEQLQLAQETIPWHMKSFGFARPNVSFRKGYIEDLRACDIPDHSVDLIVSNCVINLSPRKDLVFAEMRRVLKPGGEVYFSDVFADRRIPDDLKADPVLYGECLSGALYIEDFRRLMAAAGFADVRVMNSNVLQINDTAIQEKIGETVFVSNTIRAFALDLEDRCEDYGQVVRYKGTSTEGPHRFVLDDHHLFPTGAYVSVCGNTADMISGSRFARHFETAGTKEKHFGLFTCGPAAASNAIATTQPASVASSPCCN